MPRMTRRKFVGDVAKASLAATIVPRHVLGGPGYQAPSDTVNVAIVGAGGMGMHNAQELLSQNIVAVCDVDFNYVERSLRDRRNSDDAEAAEKGRRLTEAFNAAKRYADFRIMLDEQPDIDAVVVATPDHTHAVIANAAMKAGKHVYVQKPLTWSIYESRVLLDTAKRTGVVTQMGNQGHSTVEAGTINDWLRGGVIGEVRDVHAWTNRPIWPQGMPLPATWEQIEEHAKEAAEDEDEHYLNWRRYNQTLRLQMGLPPVGYDPLARKGGGWQVPETLNWDLYLGPAPEIAYHPLYHPFNWRGWLNFGVGALGDMGAHLFDHPYWAFGLTYPTTVEASGTAWGGPRESPATYPQATMARYQYPAAEGRPPIHITWYDGGLLPPRMDMLPEDFEYDPTGGVMYVGSDGILIHETYGQNPRLFPQGLEDRYGPAPKTGDEGPLHEMNWIHAIQGTAKATSPFEMAAPLTENMLLGLVALRTGPGKVLNYDPDNMFVVNEPDANRYLHREYRSGWRL